MTDEREALEAVLALVDGHIDPDAAQEAVMAAAEVFAAAERLDEHVKTCRKHVNFGAKNETLSSPGYTPCGDGWYCDRAPKEGRHDG